MYPQQTLVQLANSMMYLLLARFALNDLPHAAGLLNSGYPSHAGTGGMRLADEFGPGMAGPVLKGLEDYLAAYVFSEDPTVRFGIVPDAEISWPPQAAYYPESGTIRLHTPEESEFSGTISEHQEKEALSMMAHEVAHRLIDVHVFKGRPATDEELPRIEVDAIMKGADLAAKWGILENYTEDFNTYVVPGLLEYTEYPKCKYSIDDHSRDVDRIREYLKRLEKEEA